MTQILSALLAVVGGVGGAILLFWGLNKVVELAPPKLEERLKPFVFVGPALAAIAFVLVYPTITTVQASFYNEDLSELVGTKNYSDLLGSPDFVTTLVNSLMWTFFVPTLTVILGLLVAVLADRLSPRGEKTAKSLIFMPMAISMVGAAGIWKLIYDAKPAGEPQIGMFNAILAGFGAEPVNWLQTYDFKLNTFLLMIIFVWTQVGYAMVLLSAAIKGVPEDTIEAGRIDGAGEKRIFFSIVIPQVMPTIVAVFITVLIGAMKVADIVFALTGGRFNTNVIGNAFFLELYTNLDQGKASAIVVLLMIAIIPVLIYQVRSFKNEEALR